jgi:hypothetical protein
VLYEKALHPAALMRQLWIAVREENDSESQAEGQQAQRLKGIERLHQKPPRSMARIEFGCSGILAEMKTAHRRTRRQQSFRYNR